MDIVGILTEYAEVIIPSPHGGRTPMAQDDFPAVASWPIHHVKQMHRFVSKP